MTVNIYHIHALTALHAGTGQGISDIDLPIAREKATGLPLVPGTGMKGVLREELRPDNEQSSETLMWKTLFGPSSQDADAGTGFAGALTIQDAHLLCLPVRSVYGVFAWVSCPFILERYSREWGGDLMPIKELSAIVDDKVMVTEKSTVEKNQQVYLEDIVFSNLAKQQPADPIANFIAEQVFPNDDLWQASFKQRFIIVSDDVFSFLATTATEIRARIKLKPETRTVEKGALWYEENLPAESILWGILTSDPSRQPGHEVSAKQLMDDFKQQIIPEGEARLQIGGNATVGRGIVRWILSAGA